MPGFSINRGRVSAALSKSSARPLTTVLRSEASLEEELWHLRRLAATCLSADDGDWVLGDRLDDVLFFRDDGKVEPGSLQRGCPLDRHVPHELALLRLHPFVLGVVLLCKGGHLTGQRLIVAERTTSDTILRTNVANAHLVPSDWLELEALFVFRGRKADCCLCPVLEPSAALGRLEAASAGMVLILSFLARAFFGRFFCVVCRRFRIRTFPL